MKFFLLLSFLLTIIISAHGQDINEQMISAFSASYVSETSKDYDKAIKDIKSVYNERSYEANVRLGWLSYEQKNYDQSVIYYQLAIKAKPNSIEAMLGYVYPAVALEKWDDLFAMYQRILVLDPNNLLVNYRIALMYYYKKEFSSAEKQLQRNLEHYPFDYDNVLLMAQVKLAMGKVTDSKIYYRRALLYNPSNDEIRKVLNKL
jgi:tetratricopeptide (TPR) repeat protein